MFEILVLSCPRGPYYILIIYYLTTQKLSLIYFISTEAFRYNVSNFQCFSVMVQLTVITVVFPAIKVELAEVLVGLECHCIKDIMSFIM